MYRGKSLILIAPYNDPKNEWAYAVYEFSGNRQWSSISPCKNKEEARKKAKAMRKRFKKLGITLIGVK